MGGASRIGDGAHEDQRGRGKAESGSPDVLIDGYAALRVGDTGKHPDGRRWHAAAGSKGVLINGKPAVRQGDPTKHDDDDGQLVEGSPHVFVGDEAPGASKEAPHDRVLVLEVTDGLGRAVHDVTVAISCPHAVHEPKKADGTATIGGLCKGATVVVTKPLQTGLFDDGAVHGAVPYALHVDPNGTGGTPAPSDGGGKKKVVAPAPADNAPAPHAVHVASPNGSTTVVVPTVHNWVELVYRVFGHHVPKSAKDLALLGVREASLSPAPEGSHANRDDLEVDARRGDLDEVDFTREHKAPAYNDLLFCIWTDKTVHHHQHVEVFECTIDASPGKGALHLPFLREGQLFHAKPGSFHKYPGDDIALHVFHGMHEPHPKPHATVAEVLRVAHAEIGTSEHPPFSNRQKYGKWYGYDGAYWCAMFVSWVMAHAGMPDIHYMECNDGANHFRSGAWGTWHGGNDVHAHPGDIVFYQLEGPGNLDHTGVVVRDNGSSITTIEGNTSSGNSGSQDNGGGVYLRTRDKTSIVGGFGRPHYKPPHVEPTSVIRWGGEAEKVDKKAAAGSTMLHHHYFRKDKHGHVHVDPHAERYARFRSIYAHAANNAHIPYLIVSSRYVKTYSEWAKWLGAHPDEAALPRSVIHEKGLVSPHHLAHHYVPSFLTQAYADKVLTHAKHMHDHAKAAHLRAELEAALFKLSG